MSLKNLWNVTVVTELLIDLFFDPIDLFLQVPLHLGEFPLDEPLFLRGFGEIHRHHTDFQQSLERVFPLGVAVELLEVLDNGGVSNL